MPLITNKRSNANRDIVYSYVGVAYVSGETYTLPEENNRLEVNNTSTNTLTLTVNGNQYNIPPGKSKLVTGAYTQFDIAADVNSSSFEVVSMVDKEDDSETEIDTLRTQLKFKPNITDVRIRAEKIELEDLSEEALGAMSGNANFTLQSIPQDNSVTIKKLDSKLSESLVYPLANIITNGNFSNGTTGWTSSANTLSAVNNILSATALSSSTKPSLSQTTNYTIVTNNQIYLSGKIRVTNANCQYIHVILSGVGDTGNTVYAVTAPAADQWYEFSVILTTPSTFTAGYLKLLFRHQYADTATALNKVLQIRDVVAIDITQAFGFGTEKTKTEMDSILASFPNKFFDGSENLFKVKDVMQDIDELKSVSANVDKLEALTSISATNLVDNGDFSSAQDYSSWGYTYSTGAVDTTRNTLVVTGNGTGDRVSISKWLGAMTATEQRYFSAKVKVTDPSCLKLRISITGNTAGVIEKVIEPPVANQEYELSISGMIEGFQGTSVSIGVAAYYADAATALGKKLEVRYPIALNLTEIFGAGNEIKTKDIDILLSKFPNRWFDGSENLFSAKELAGALNNDLRPNKGAFLKVNEIGQIEASSGINVNWDKWALQQYSYGMSKKANVPVYNKFHGVLETDAMFSVQALYGRWTQNAVFPTEGYHQWGGHIFEGWNAPRTYRYTVLIGKNAVNETCIFTFAPPSDEVPGQEGGGGTFGVTRVGSDKTGEGFEIIQKQATMNGTLKITDGLTLSASKTPASSTATGTKGEICYDSNYMYVCVATNTWKRTPLSTW